MLNIKKNIDEINFYVGLNREAFIKEVNNNSSFDFYDKYLIELTPREFIDFLNFLTDYISDDDTENNHHLSALLTYMSNSESTFPDFSSIVERVDYLKQIHTVERIKNENQSLKKEIKADEKLKSINERL